jgi:hypothetical protein
LAGPSLSAPRRKQGQTLFFLLLACAFALAWGEERSLEIAPGVAIQYRLVEGAGDASARQTAEKLLRHLADGDIEGAALLSNAPRRRYEELARYRTAVGEDEFKRVFAAYFLPANRVVAEISIGQRRLLIWDLGDAGHHLAGQYYVETEGRFLMDDAPGEMRSRLRRVLEAYRSGKLKF